MDKLLVMTSDNKKAYKIAPAVKNSRATQGGSGRHFNPFVRGKGITDNSIEECIYTIKRTREVWTKKMNLWEGSLGGKIIHNQ